MKIFKKSYSSFYFNLIIFLLLSIFLSLNLISYINLRSVLSLVLLIIFSLFLLILLIYLIYFLLLPNDLLKIDDNKIIYKKKEIKYDDVFTIFSSNNSSIFLDSYLILYFNNGDKLKIKHLKLAKNAELIIRKHLKNPNFLIEKEDKIYKFFIRSFNLITSCSQHFMKFKKAKILNSFEEIVNEYKKRNLKRVFVISFHSEAINPLLTMFKEADIEIYLSQFKITNPTNELIYSLKEEYLKFNADSILAIGGGSKIDAAKALGVTLTNKKDLEKYSGLFKVKHNIPFLIAIPTLPASGSETTIASVISYKDKKCSIMSNKIVPSYTYLGNEFLLSLKSDKLLNSVSDALTHALEAYLNVFKNKKYDNYALKAIKLINDNLINALENDDLNSKQKLLEASYYAGIAFSFKGVGNVHALSHALSYKYNLEHAKTNGIILPYVLKTYIYNKKARKKLSNIAILLNLSNNKKDIKNNAKLTLSYIYNLLKYYGLNGPIKEIKLEDIEFMAHHAKKEANPLYGTPITYTLKEYSYMYLNLKNELKE